MIVNEMYFNISSWLEVTFKEVHCVRSASGRFQINSKRYLVLDKYFFMTAFKLVTWDKSFYDNKYRFSC